MNSNIVQFNSKISVLELVNLLQENTKYIIINLQHLKDNYQRRGIKRIKGYRDEYGNAIEPAIDAEFLDRGEYVRIADFKLNRHTATINMLITRPVKLVKSQDGTSIEEVAGLLFTNVETFNNYTLVSDGEVNVQSLQVKISHQKLFDLLKSKGVIAAATYNFRDEYTIRLDNLPIVPLKDSYASIDGVFEELAEIKIVASIFSALLKKQSDVYTTEQLEELEANYLSKNQYLNFPTTTEYADLRSALANGQVNSRVSYKVDIGSKEILNLGKLHSANKFLDRMYDVYRQDSGENLKKHTFAAILNEKVVFYHKTLSSRTKITKVDELMQRIFDNFLDIEDNGSVSAMLSKVGAGNLMPMLQAKWNGENLDRSDFIAALSFASEKLEDYLEKVYREKINRLVFYIGATGHLPKEFDRVAQTAEELAIKYPDLQFSKHEQKGIFFEVGDTIISVYPQKEYYSPKMPA